MFSLPLGNKRSQKHQIDTSGSSKVVFAKDLTNFKYVLALLLTYTYITRLGGSIQRSASCVVF